jgi:hypothetical protein
MSDNPLCRTESRCFATAIGVAGADRDNPQRRNSVLGQGGSFLTLCCLRLPFSFAAAYGEGFQYALTITQRERTMWYIGHGTGDFRLCRKRVRRIHREAKVIFEFWKLFRCHGAHFRSNGGSLARLLMSQIVDARFNRKPLG